MDSRIPFAWPPPVGNNEVFLRKDIVGNFVVTDELSIFPSSDSLKSNICAVAGVKYGSTFDLEEQAVLVDNDQVIHLSLICSIPSTFLLLLVS